MLQDYDIVRLTRDLVDVEDSNGKLMTIPAGTYGTILIVYCAKLGYPENTPPDYEVEFGDDSGNTIALVIVNEADLELDSTYEQREVNSRKNRE